jgi:cadmium resistance protein CadD (predicted permease)
LNTFTRTVPLKWYQKISVYCGFFLGFLWWIVFYAFMENVKKLQVKGEVLLEMINLIPVNWEVLDQVRQENAEHDKLHDAYQEFCKTGTTV